jgi:hypothetical protein
MLFLGAGQTSVPPCSGHSAHCDPAPRTLVHFVDCRGRLDRRILDCMHNVTGRYDREVECQRQWALMDMKGS